MDKARKREEVYNRDKGEALFVEAQELSREALSLYHKDWPTATSNLLLASTKLKKAITHFTKAGLVAARLKEMTPGARRVHARDIMDILVDESLTFLSEPKLPEVVVTDFLDRSAPITELLFRLESEMEKCRARSEGDQHVNTAIRAIDQGSKDQKVGLFASANTNFNSAKALIVQAQQSFDSIMTSSPDLAARWMEQCNQEDIQPMLTREKHIEIEQALRARDKSHFWKPREWTVEKGLDVPTLYCVGQIEVGIQLSDINNEFRFDHSEEGIYADGRDTVGIMTRLQDMLQAALKAQEEDMAFKAFAICAIPELFAARAACVDGADSDRAAREAAADEHIAKPPELLEQDRIIWNDLPPEKLGPIAVSDEVLELHQCARAGNCQRMRHLLDNCTVQHYVAINEQHKPYKATFEARISADSRNHDAKTPLMQCAKYNQEFAAAVLLEAKASVNATDLNRETALHLAAGNGAAEMMKLLVKEGASLAATNIAGMNAAHFCARYSLGDIDCARTLVLSGMDLNLTDHKQQTLLHHLVTNRRYGSKELFMLHFFLIMGADADARDMNGKTALDLCDDPDARQILQRAYHIQKPLRIEKWGPTGLPPLSELAPVGLIEQQMAITLGVPLLCVLHKGHKAFVNREECRACTRGLVVTVPFKDTTDYCHMCCNCGVKDVTNHFVRDPRGFI